MRSWLTELKQSSPVVQIKGSVKDSLRVPEFDMKHPKKDEGHIGRNFMIIKMNMRSIARIFFLMIYIYTHIYMHACF